ncbi:MAG: hypothetical protein K2F74_03030 [Muribaculaceae bacterium]|nr:hypothetical protein [Muribaculaceae bacterium]MDE5930203.1 hypothetical protein [Muribaculaceae bacterium]MDE6130544.1 hypothetical protein [Muribaculaceae bacterium]
MIQNSVTTAPESDSIAALYARWRQTRAGTMDDFYRFMTTPTAEREFFLESCKVEISTADRTVTAIYKAAEDVQT